MIVRDPLQTFLIEWRYDGRDTKISYLKWCFDSGKLQDYFIERTIVT